MPWQPVCIVSHVGSHRKPPSLPPGSSLRPCTPLSSDEYVPHWASLLFSGLQARWAWRPLCICCQGDQWRTNQFRKVSSTVYSCGVWNVWFGQRCCGVDVLCNLAVNLLRLVLFSLSCYFLEYLSLSLLLSVRASTLNTTSLQCTLMVLKAACNNDPCYIDRYAQLAGSISLPSSLLLHDVCVSLALSLSL